jgi:hypothetical protein
VSLVADPNDLMRRYSKYKTDPSSMIIVDLCKELIKTRTKLGLARMELNTLQKDMPFNYVTLPEFRKRFPVGVANETT